MENFRIVKREEKIILERRIFLFWWKEIKKEELYERSVIYKELYNYWFETIYANKNGIYKKDRKILIDEKFIKESIQKNNIGVCCALYDIPKIIEETSKKDEELQNTSKQLAIVKWGINDGDYENVKKLILTYNHILDTCKDLQKIISNVSEEQEKDREEYRKKHST